MTTVMKNEIKTMVEETVEEIFRREMRNLYASLLPYVSKAEQKDIEKQKQILEALRGKRKSS